MPGDQPVYAVPNGPGNQPQGMQPSIGPAEAPGDAKRRVGLGPRPFPVHQDDGTCRVARCFERLEKPCAGLGLQRNEAERASFSVTDHEVDRTAAQVAEAVEQDHRRVERVGQPGSRFIRFLDRAFVLSAP